MSTRTRIGTSASRGKWKNLSDEEEGDEESDLSDGLDLVDSRDVDDILSEYGAQSQHNKTTDCNKRLAHNGLDVVAKRRRWESRPLRACAR